jgi:hypothetical protein
MRSITRDTTRVPTNQTRSANSAALPNANASGIPNGAMPLASVERTGSTTSAITVKRSSTMSQRRAT